MKVFTKEEFLLRKQELFEKVKKGVLFVYPTDTLYGLGCNAVDEKAVQRLRKVKGNVDRPLSVIVPSKGWIIDNCEVGAEITPWLEGKLPGPYTLILKLRSEKAVANNVSFGKTLGIRIPDHWISKEFEELELPIVTTSLNIAGEEPVTKISDIPTELRKEIEFAIDDGEIKGKASTIVDLTKEKVEIKER